MNLTAFCEHWLVLLPITVIAYLLGSVNFAILVTRIFFHADIRDSGSGNAGATNVLRTYGTAAAAVTAIGDLGKSVLSVWLGGWFITAWVPDAAPLIGRYLAGVCCMIGHIYPLYFGFRGGKGVITALGTLLVLDWRLALCCLGVFIAVTAAWRMVSLGSVCAACALPLFTVLLIARVDARPPEVWLFCVISSAVMGTILVIKHRTNLQRIRQGTENKLSFRRFH